MITRRSFLGVAFAGIVPLVGCGGGSQEDDRAVQLVTDIQAHNMASSGRYICGGRNTTDSVLACIWFNGISSPETSIHPAGYRSSTALGISDNGQVAALVASLTLDPLQSQAILWKKGEFISLHPDGYAESRINWMSADGRVQRGAVRKAGTQQLEPVTWNSTKESIEAFIEPEGFNSYFPCNSGDGNLTVTGEYTRNAKLWNSGVEIELHPREFYSSFAIGISKNGRYQVGSCKATEEQEPQAALWEGSRDSLRLLPTNNWYRTQASHVTNDGHLIAGAGLQTKTSKDWTENAHALIWHEASGTMVDLHLLLPEPDKFERSLVTAIDNAGNILGHAIASNRHYTAYWRAV